MIEHFIERFVLVKQGFCGFLPDARDARDVVGRVAAKRLIVDETLRGEAVRGKARKVHDLDLAHSLFRPIDARRRARELEAVAVAREDDGVVRRVRREGAQDVVRLVALHGDDGDFHEREQLLEGLELLREFRVHGFAGALIRRIEFVTEGGRFEVESRRHVSGSELFDYAQEYVEKTVDRARMHPLGRREPRERMIGAMDDAVGIYKQKSVVGHIIPRRCPPRRFPPR